jgi:hypothetical protein
MKKLITCILLFAGICFAQDNDGLDRYYYNNNTIVGLQWNSTLDTYARLGVAQSQSNFDGIAPWKNMRRCNLSDAGVVTAYYGDANYKEDGSNGQVMVEIPAFYYKTVILSSGYQWFISSTPMSGYSIHPAFVRNGVQISKIYMSAYEGSVYDVSAPTTRQTTWTINTGASATGTITITADGVISITVSVTSGMTTTQVATAVMNAINTFNYSPYGETISATINSNVITSTYGAPGLKQATVIDVASTGVTFTGVVVTAGSGGYCVNDPTGYDFTATTGDKFSSVANVKPATGWHNNLTIVNARILAHNRGTGWEQEDFLTTSAIQMLYLIEYGTFNSQSAISQGITNITADGITNMAVLTGKTSSLGNKSGQVSNVHYKTAQITHPMSYRGVENLYGNIWKFVDGINIQADYKPYVADHGFASDLFTSPYTYTGITIPNADGYITNINELSTFNYGFLPLTVGGSSSTYITDYYNHATGNRIVLLGGSWAAGGSVGAFSCDAVVGSGDVDRSVGGRLLYVPSN